MSDRKRQPRQAKPDADYDIGYCKPPKKHQFQKGQPSPNPRGRARVSQTSVDLGKILMAPIKIKIDSEVRRVTFVEAVMEMAKARTLGGDFRMAKMMIELFKELNLIAPMEIPEHLRKITVQLVQAERKEEDLREINAYHAQNGRPPLER